VNPPLNQKELGARMRAAREAIGETLLTADARTGIPSVVLGSYERGDRNPSLHRAAEWVAAFGHRLVVLSPDERVVSTKTTGEVWVSYVVVYGPNEDGVIECDSEAEAEVLAQHINLSKVGRRVNQRGDINFGGPW